LQNGLGNLEVIERVIENNNLFAGITTMGATVIGLNHIRQAGAGSTFVGPLGNNKAGAEKLTKMLSKAGINATATQDTLGMLWSKLVINAAICPVSVLANLPNGELVKNEKWRVLLGKAAEEAGAVAAAKGIKLLFDDPVKAVLEVCEKTAANISSMLQDIRRGRQTEIEAVNGVIIRSAAEAGIAAPTNVMLCKNVVELEKRSEHNCRKEASEPN
jgi:2-dehydropantoate 2-reductase